MYCICRVEYIEHSCCASHLSGIDELPNIVGPAALGTQPSNRQLNKLLALCGLTMGGKSPLVLDLAEFAPNCVQNYSWVHLTNALCPSCCKIGLSVKSATDIIFFCELQLLCVMDWDYLSVSTFR